MKISVVMVSLNSVVTIGHAVESFLCQTHADKELIIVDGGSTDGTLQVVESLRAPNLRVVSEPDRGLYDGMNKGLALFAGDAIGFLNSDNRFSDEVALAAIAEGLGEVDMVFGHLDFVLDHDRREVSRRWRTAPYRKGAFRRGWMPAHPTFYCRREVAETVGTFDLSYAIASDYDYMLRAFELSKFTARPINRVLVDMLHGGCSTASMWNYVSHNLEALASRRKWLGTGIVDYALIAKPLRKITQFFLVGHVPPRDRIATMPMRSGGTRTARDGFMRANDGKR
ncbi:glycosyltransferase (plasmid) [Bradyrhizobium sp. ISRA443]|uniref:glycosyltransferase family 2 protein n=1 Tax=unclassified Bradyrhizobium TaxID=2631580 RepID=UPI0024786FBB|nr:MULTISPECIES: glycosyltransferase family 2 protein [unclassified Bradyrhizobium]WGR90779.1 glycosyltransferase [Bradyrhizobium sp. ISRA435]WGS03090.1 glycosyltransferase [Bradyrhizobium sp. ISRA436]WGS09877.1 glycosyltransferase [Bradyrhizobium sp. ISRA437]WGS16762.1 glycosyltransferase [Bradyrhizobium sp. ISRA443]